MIRRSGGGESIVQKETREGLKVKSTRMREGWDRRRLGWGNSRSGDGWNDKGLSCHPIVSLLREVIGTMAAGSHVVHKSSRKKDT